MLMRVSGRKRMLLCDTDERYVNHLAEYLIAQEEFPFALWYYTQIHEMLDFLHEEEVFLLLIQEEIYQEIGNCAHAENVFLLTTDTEKCTQSLGAMRESITNAEYRAKMTRYIYKYQSAEEIMMTIYHCCTETIQIPSRVAASDTCKLIGFFSPIARCLQTTVSMTMSQMLAKQKKVLYLNFEGCSSYHSTQTGLSFDLSDLVYYYLNSRDKFLYRLSTMTQNVNGAHLIPPARTYMDIHNIKPEEWCNMLVTIRDSSLYDVIVLDLSRETGGIFEILELCEIIYSVITKDTISVNKITQYQKMLDFLGVLSITEKTTYIEIEQQINIPEDPAELIFSNLTSLISKYLPKEEREVYDKL